MLQQTNNPIANTKKNGNHQNTPPSCSNVGNFSLHTILCVICYSICYQKCKKYYWWWREKIYRVWEISNLLKMFLPFPDAPHIEQSIRLHMPPSFALRWPFIICQEFQDEIVAAAMTHMLCLSASAIVHVAQTTVVHSAGLCLSQILLHLASILDTSSFKSTIWDYYGTINLMQQSMSIPMVEIMKRPKLDLMITNLWVETCPL